MIKKIKSRAKDDNGNAIILLGIMLIMVTLLVGGMMLDLTKASQMKTSYNDSARKATQTAIRQQNTQGNLIAEAAGEAFYFYEEIARPDIINDGYMSSCDNTRNVELTVHFMKDKLQPGTHTATINSNQINKSDNAKSVTSKMKVNGAPITTNLRTAIENGKYKGVILELTETTPNVILPGAMNISGIDGDNIKCQKIGVQAGADQLIGATDGTFN